MRECFAETAVSGKRRVGLPLADGDGVQAAAMLCSLTAEDYDVKERARSAQGRARGAEFLVDDALLSYAAEFAGSAEDVGGAMLDAARTSKAAVQDAEHMRAVADDSANGIVARMSADVIAEQHAIESMLPSSTAVNMQLG